MSIGNLKYSSCMSVLLFYNTLCVYLLCCCCSHNTYNLVRDWNSRQYDVRTEIGTKTKKLLIKTTVRPREATQNYTEDLGRATHTLSFLLSLAGPTEKPCKKGPYTQVVVHTHYIPSTVPTQAKPLANLSTVKTKVHNQPSLSQKLKPTED